MKFLRLKVLMGFVPLLYCLSMISCHCASCDQCVRNIRQKDTIFLDIRGTGYKYLSYIPDSLRTAQQNVYFDRLKRVLYKNVVVKNNHFVLNISKKDFLATGLSEKDYDELQRNLCTNNIWIDSLGIKDADQINKDSKAQGFTKKF